METCFSFFGNRFKKCFSLQNASLFIELNRSLRDLIIALSHITSLISMNRLALYSIFSSFSAPSFLSFSQVLTISLYLHISADLAVVASCHGNGRAQIPVGLWGFCVVLRLLTVWTALQFQLNSCSTSGAGLSSAPLFHCTNAP